MPEFRVEREHMKIERQVLGEISQFSFLTCIQQSVMNFGILMVQGLVNSFGTSVMAAFAAGVKIDTLAYMRHRNSGMHIRYLSRRIMGRIKKNGSEKEQKALP